MSIGLLPAELRFFATPANCGSLSGAARDLGVTTPALSKRLSLYGEIAVNWALDGHGILMRAQWDVERYLASGLLVQVPAHYQTPDADTYALYPQRHRLCARIRTFVGFLSQSLARFSDV